MANRTHNMRLTNILVAKDLRMTNALCDCFARSL